MKNNGKNRSHVESFSASEAASLLGVSIPTLKRMVVEGRLESFRTPGGHLRILAESVDTLRESKRSGFARCAMLRQSCRTGVSGWRS